MILHQQPSTLQIAEVHRQTGSLKRDSFLDAWRGIFHIVILVDHMPILFPGIFTLIASIYEALGYLSAAEGFVFLSGFVSGLVYTRIKQEKGDRAMWYKAFLRARDIYLFYVLAVVMLVALAQLGGTANLSWGTWSGLLEMSLPGATVKTIGLLYQPEFLEILPMYSLLILITPLVLHYLEKDKYVLVGGISLLIWIFAQFGIRDVLLRLLQRHMDIQFGFFNAFGWQILFVIGLTCGHRTYVCKTPWLPRGWLLPALAYALALIFFSFKYDLVGIQLDDRWVGRSVMAPLRLLNILCIAFLICKARQYIEKYIVWNGFALLSKHSLQVFAFHLFPIYFVGLVLGVRTSLSVWMQLFCIGLCLLGLFLIAFFSQMIKTWLFNSNKMACVKV